LPLAIQVTQKDQLQILAENREPVNPEKAGQLRRLSWRHHNILPTNFISRSSADFRT